MPRILAIVDELTLAAEIAAALLIGGFQYVQRFDGASGLEIARLDWFDGAIIDGALLKASSADVLKGLRQLCSDIPVLIVGPMSDDQSATLPGHRCDDLAWPLIWPDFTTRLKGLLCAWPRPAAVSSCVHDGDLYLDPSAFRVRFGSRQVTLSPAEFKLFEFMLSSAGRQISNRVIFEAVWGYEFEPPPQLIEAHLNALNEKIHQLGAPIALRAPPAQAAPP